MSNAIYQNKEYCAREHETIYWFGLYGREFGVVERDGRLVEIIDCEFMSIPCHSMVYSALERAVTNEMRAE